MKMAGYEPRAANSRLDRLDRQSGGRRFRRPESGTRSGWIVAARRPRVTAADASDALVSTAHRTVLLHGLDEVLAATGLEAAHGRQNRPDCCLIAAYRGDQQ